MRFIFDIREELEITILMVKHDIRAGMNIGDQTCVINFGQKIAEGLPSENHENPLVLNVYLGRRRPDHVTLSKGDTWLVP